MDREYNQAMGIAKDAKRIAESAAETANKAHLVAQLTTTRHDQHEKVCAERYREIISVNTKSAEHMERIGDKIDKITERNSNKSFAMFKWVVGIMVTIIGSLIGYIAYGS